MKTFKQKFIQGLCKLYGYTFVSAESFDCTGDWFQIPFFIDETISEDSTRVAFENVKDFLEQNAMGHKRKFANIVGMKVDSNLFFGKME